MRQGLTGHLIIRNGVRYDYCFEEAVASIIDWCDGFIILEAHSEDETMDRCVAMRHKYHPKLRIIHGDWDGPEPEGYEFRRLSRLTNQCIEGCETTWNWAVQGDEAYHEGNIDIIRRVVEGKTSYGPEWPQALMFPYVHLVGNPWTQFPFVYQAAVRMVRTDSTWRSDNDGWRMHPSDPAELGRVLHMRYPVCFHYGKLGNPFKKILKERDFQMLFRAEGFPDPRVVEMAERGEIDYAYLFEETMKRGLFSPFEGTHPAVMKDWLDSHSQWWQSFTE